MVNWREKIWMKILCLTVAGIFSFQEFTWAAKADLSLSLPPAVSSSSQEAVHPTGLKNILNNIFQKISSFLSPSAYAYEVSNTGGQMAYNILPALNDKTWKPVRVAVNVNDTVPNDNVNLPVQVVSVQAAQQSVPPVQNPEPSALPVTTERPLAVPVAVNIPRTLPLTGTPAGGPGSAPGVTSQIG
mgnify:CR=1 FL=1